MELTALSARAVVVAGRGVKRVGQGGGRKPQIPQNSYKSSS